MNMDRWTQSLDSAFTRAGHEFSGLLQAAGGFLEALTLLEKSLLGGLGLLMVCYICMPGSRSAGADGSSNKAFAGLLLLFVSAGVVGGLFMTGRISL